MNHGGLLIKRPEDLEKAKLDALIDAWQIKEASVTRINSIA